MRYLPALQSCQSLSDLADLLGYSPRGLSYIVYKIPDAHRYKERRIPKKNGGSRLISIPDKRLKKLQRVLSKYLMNCYLEIFDPKGDLNQLPHTGIAHAFLPGRSITTNAHHHKSKRYVFNVDLKDFFPSIHFGRIIGFLQKNRNFRLKRDVAILIAKICCHNGRLPQGSPCSPIISNLIGSILDTRLARLAKENGCFYTRYADDLTFSINTEKFPISIARKVRGRWSVGKDLRKQIESSGFLINDKKTRMQYDQSRQSVTGLVVNRHPNVPSNYYRVVRAQCNSLFQNGSYYNFRDIEFGNKGWRVWGVLSKIVNIKYFLFLPRYFRFDTREYYPESPKYPEGRLNHIVNIELTRRKISNRRGEENSKYRLYEKFLFFKHFVNNEAPTIICEGKTDVLYLKSILSYYKGSFANLFSGAAGARTIKVNLLSVESKAASWLGISGGTGNIRNFISFYRKNRSRYKFKRRKNPVIILVDNDDGATNGLYSIVKEKSGKKIDLKHHEKIYNIEENLYLVPTPQLGHSGKSCIENFFKDDALNVKIGNKTLSLSNSFDSGKHYGKDLFSKKVVATRKKSLDFSGFREVLQRISDAIDYEKAK